MTLNSVSVQVKIYPVKAWKIEKNKIETFYFKNSYWEEFQTIELNDKSNTIIQPLVDLKQVYKVPLEIKDNKKKDLLTFGKEQSYFAVLWQLL